jgi:hypothetical protein
MDRNARRGAARWFAAGAMAVALASMLLLAAGIANNASRVSAGPCEDDPNSVGCIPDVCTHDCVTPPIETSTQEVVETPDPTETPPPPTTPPTNTAVPTSTTPPTSTTAPSATPTNTPQAQVAAAVATAPPVVRALPATGTGTGDNGSDSTLLMLGLVGLMFSVGLGALSWKYSRSQG